MRLFKVIIIVFLIIMVSSCTKKPSNSHVTIKMDPSLLGTNPYSGKVTSSNTAGDGPQWGLPDPSSLGDIHCYGVFVSGPEDEMSHSFCTNDNDAIIEFGPRAGFFTISEIAEMEVLPGLARTFYLVGMSSADGTCASGFDEDPDVNGPNHSNPFIIGQATVDLVEGDNIIEIPLDNSFTSHKKIKDCSFFEGDNTGTTPTAPPANAAQIVFSEGSSFDFGSVPVGGSASHIFTITNEGLVDATTLSAMSLPAPISFTGGSFPGTGGTCVSSLVMGTSCTIDITYSPTTNVSHSANLDISYYDGSNIMNSTLPIMGLGRNPALLNISEVNPYDYGTIATGGASNHIFTITNTGELTATSIADGGGLAAPFIFAGGSFPGTGGDCTPSLPPSASCTMVVDFTPGITGLQADTIDITYNDSLSAQTTSRDIQGTGAMPALLSISPGSTYNFGTVSTSGGATNVFTITNSGGVPATGMTPSGLMTPFNFTLATYPGTSGTCGATLTNGGNCTIELEFSPASMIYYNETLTLNYNDGASAQIVTLTVDGTGGP